MFPVGTVLVPGMLLPLRVFEPRYRRMLDDCMAGDQSFGVVLIERGSEVGGGDVRVDVGTMARIVYAEGLADGTWALVVLGVRRIRVDRWMPDDPYPCAETTDWPDALADRSTSGDATSGGAVGSMGGGTPSSARDPVVRQLRRAAALSRELGRPSAPLDLELDDDPVTGSYQAMVAASLGPADCQRLLAAPTVANRWTLLTSLLTDQIELLEALLAHDT